MLFEWRSANHSPSQRGRATTLSSLSFQEGMRSWRNTRQVWRRRRVEYASSRSAVQLGSFPIFVLFFFKRSAAKGAGWAALSVKRRACGDIWQYTPADTVRFLSQESCAFARCAWTRPSEAARLHMAYVCTPAADGFQMLLLSSEVDLQPRDSPMRESTPRSTHIRSLWTTRKIKRNANSIKCGQWKGGSERASQVLKQAQVCMDVFLACLVSAIP